MATGRKGSSTQTPATRFLRSHGISFEELSYEYQEHGGATHSAEVLGLDPYHVVKTLTMQDELGRPLIVLMHGDRTVSTKNLARRIGAKMIRPCEPEVAERHSGYRVGGTSPFATRRAMPIYVEATILGLPRIAINGGRRGLLLWLEPRVLTELLQATAVECALVS